MPSELKHALDEGELGPNQRIALDAALDAVDALNWTTDGEVSTDKVLELAKRMVELRLRQHRPGVIEDTF